MTFLGRCVLPIVLAVACRGETHVGRNDGPPSAASVPQDAAPATSDDTAAGLLDGASTSDASDSPADSGPFRDSRYEFVQHPPAVRKPDWSLFLAAGCDRWLNCSGASFMETFACKDTMPGFGLGGLVPALPIMKCIADSGEGLWTVGGLHPRGLTYVLAQEGGGFERIISKEQFVQRFAPVESPEEAVSFVLALERGTVVLDHLPDTRDFRIRAARIESSYAVAEDEGFRVHVFRPPGLGCGSKPWMAVDYRVTPAGEITLLGGEPVYEDPRDDGCHD